MSAAIALLAGGAARRFPDKLTQAIDGQPMVLRTYANVRGRWPVCVVARATFLPEIDAQLDCSLVVDRWPGRGPLGALLTACDALWAPVLFAVAADMPNASRAVLETLFAGWRDDDEALVPRTSNGLQPLCAAYARAALLREGFAVLQRGDASMHALLDRLRTRALPFDDAPFHNVNTRADLEFA